MARPAITQHTDDAEGDSDDHGQWFIPQQVALPFPRG
jgi:hypothetical protein